MQDEYSDNNLNELRSDFDADIASRQSIFNSRNNTTGAGPHQSYKMKAVKRKKSANKSVSKTRALPGKKGSRNGYNDTSQMESMMSKHNHTIR